MDSTNKENQDNVYIIKSYGKDEALVKVGYSADKRRCCKRWKVFRN